MSLPTSQPIPEESSHEGEEILRLPPARRRRGRRLILPVGTDKRTAFLDELAHRATPNLDYFIFSLVAGAVFGAALLLNSPAFMILAALLAPFMGPVIGLSLATIVGSGRFFLLSLSGSLTGAVLVFAGGLLAGFGAQIWPDLVFEQALLGARFSWPTFVLLSLGTVITTLSMVRSDRKPLLPSVALAYAMYLPVAAAGFGLASGTPGLFPEGLVIFLVSLAWTTLLGTIVLALQGFRPLNLFGYTLGTSIALTSLTVLIGLSGLGTALRSPDLLPDAPSEIAPLSSPSAAPRSDTPQPSEPSATQSVMAATATLTHQPTNTLIPTRTRTITATVAPTPVWALINARTSNGALIRENPEPGSKIMTSILNGSLVEVLPEVLKEGGAIWVHVRTEAGVEGWILQTLLQTATPSPDW